MRTFLSQVDQALNDHKSKIFVPIQSFLSIVVVFSIASIILETVHSLSSYNDIFIFIEWTAAIIFAVEYCARLATAKKKLGYVFSFWGLIDLFSILPTFLSVANLTFLKAARVLRILRLMRIFRLAKVSRAYLKAHEKAKSQADLNHINIFIYFLALFSTTILFGSTLYIVENHQEAYSNIPLAMLQVSKVFVGGLGFVPATTLAGQIIIVLSGFVGLALFALLISVVGGFLQERLLGPDKKEK